MHQQSTASLYISCETQLNKHCTGQQTECDIPYTPFCPLDYLYT